MQVLSADAERAMGAAEKATGGALEALDNWCALADLSVYAERRAQLLEAHGALVDVARSLELSLHTLQSRHAEWHSLFSRLRAQLGVCVCRCRHIYIYIFVYENTKRVTNSTNMFLCVRRSFSIFE